MRVAFFYVLFQLTEPQHGGGDVVFPSLNINVAPEKVLFKSFYKKVIKINIDNIQA
jgi:hypothetical protein